MKLLDGAWTLESGTVTLGKTLSSLGFSLPNGRRACDGRMRALSALLSPLVDSGPRCCWTPCTPADTCVPCPCWHPGPTWPCPNSPSDLVQVTLTPAPSFQPWGLACCPSQGSVLLPKACWTLPALCLECSSLDINITEFFRTLFFLFKYQLPR